MITVSLLPFFLAARTCLPVAEQQGPQFLFSITVTVDSVDHNLDEDEGLKERVFDFYVGAACHLVTEDTLHCQVKSTDSLTGHTARHLYLPKFLRRDGSFELLFDENGLRDAWTSSKDQPKDRVLAWVGGLSSAVDPLNVGLDLGLARKGVVTVNETSYLGRCRTRFQISTHRESLTNELPHKRGHSLGHKDPYEARKQRLLRRMNTWSESVYEMMPMLACFSRKRGEVLKIVKERDTESCDGSSRLLTEYNAAAGGELALMRVKKVVSSMSRLTVSDKDFEAVTAQEILATDTLTGDNVLRLEQIKVKLEGIAYKRAKEEKPLERKVKLREERAPVAEERSEEEEWPGQEDWDLDTEEEEAYSEEEASTEQPLYIEEACNLPANEEPVMKFRWCTQV